MIKTRLLILVCALAYAQLHYGQSEITTEKITVTNGATNNYILKSDAQGNATWVNPSTIIASESSNWTLNGVDLFNANTGQIGIGTNSPGAKLMIVGGSDVNLSSEPFLQLGLTNGINMAVDNNEIQVRDNGVAANLFLQKDGGDASLASGGGSVAIGKSSPNATLDVDGNIHAGIIQTNSTRIEINELGTGDRNAIIDFHGSDAEADFSARLFRQLGQDGDFRVENRGAGNLAFRTSNINRAVVKPDGKFLIGHQLTATPGNYLLYVEDGILTERVKIATIGTADWADYVFEEDYDLHTLEEVAEFVKENKHLPNVPSALDVHEKGYELQLMDAKLLEKIEELYLLTIQLNKEKNDLEQKNDELKEALNGIHKRLEKLEKNRKWTYSN